MFLFFSCCFFVLVVCLFHGFNSTTSRGKKKKHTGLTGRNGLKNRLQPFAANKKRSLDEESSENAFFLGGGGCYMAVSKNSDTPKSSILIGVFHYKPSILGYPYFWKHLYIPQFFWGGTIPWFHDSRIEEVGNSRNFDTQLWHEKSFQGAFSIWTTRIWSLEIW